MRVTAAGTGWRPDGGLEAPGLLPKRSDRSRSGEADGYTEFAGGPAEKPTDVLFGAEPQGTVSVRPAARLSATRSPLPYRAAIVAAVSNRGRESRTWTMAGSGWRMLSRPAGLSWSTKRASWPARVWSTWSSRQWRVAGRATSSSGSPSGQGASRTRTARYSSMTITDPPPGGSVHRSRRPRPAGVIVLSTATFPLSLPSGIDDKTALSCVLRRVHGIRERKEGGRG